MTVQDSPSIGPEVGLFHVSHSVPIARVDRARHPWALGSVVNFIDEVVRPAASRRFRIGCF